MQKTNLTQIEPQGWNKLPPIAVPNLTQSSQMDRPTPQRRGRAEKNSRPPGARHHITKEGLPALKGLSTRDKATRLTARIGRHDKVQSAPHNAPYPATPPYFEP